MAKRRRRQLGALSSTTNYVLFGILAVGALAAYYFTRETKDDAPAKPDAGKAAGSSASSLAEKVAAATGDSSVSNQRRVFTTLVKNGIVRELPRGLVKFNFQQLKS
jgi:hypothetical protein